MKRSFPINLAGKVYYIDEDAYELLDKYLTNLALTFNGEDDREIVVDIETRISEIFFEKISDSSQAITLDDVSKVIDIIGSPEQMAEDDPEPHTRADADKEAREKDGTESQPGPTPPPYSPAGTTSPIQDFMNKKFYRDINDKVLGGVISGLCNYLGFKNVPLARFLFVLALFIPYGALPLIMLYILAWLIFPAAVTAQQRLEMLGNRVTVDNIGQTVKEQYVYSGHMSPPSQRSGLGQIVAIIGKLGLAILALIALPVLISGAIGIVVSVFGLICLIFMSPFEFISMFAPGAIHPPTAINHLPLMGFTVFCWCMVVIIPCVTILWSACNVFFDAHSPSRKLIISAIILEMIFFVIGIILSLIFSALV